MEYQKKRQEFEIALNGMQETRSVIKEWIDDISPYYETKTADAPKPEIPEVYFAAVQINYKMLGDKLIEYTENFREFDKCIDNPQEALPYANTLESILKDVNEILTAGSNALRNFRSHYDEETQSFF